jgi:hypothetical protein
MSEFDEDEEDREIPDNPNSLMPMTMDVVVGRPPIQMTCEIVVDPNDPAKAQEKIRTIVRMFTQAIPPASIEKWEQMVRHRNKGK